MPREGTRKTKVAFACWKADMQKKPGMSVLTAREFRRLLKTQGRTRRVAILPQGIPIFFWNLRRVKARVRSADLVLSFKPNLIQDAPLPEKFVHPRDWLGYERYARAKVAREQKPRLKGKSGTRVSDWNAELRVDAKVYALCAKRYLEKRGLMNRGTKKA